MMTKTTLLSDLGVDEKYLAHSPKESLIAHSNLTLKYYYKILKVKNLEGIIDKLLLKIDKENFDLLKEMFINTIYLHDVGKINPNFQFYKMKNDLFKDKVDDTKNSNHSFYSSEKFIEYYKEILNKIQNRKTKEKLKFILYAFSYYQAKHHGKLGVFEEYRKKEIFWSYLDKFDIPSFEFYILNKLLFSLLISSDYYATIDYMANLKTENFGTFSKSDKNKLITQFSNYTNKFENPKGINVFREAIKKESEKTLLLNLDKNIFYLEAPTGSGKTLISINLALQLLKNDEKLNKLFYIFPFNTLVEQTKNVFDEVFDELDIEVINSITPMNLDEKNQENEETKYQKSYVNRLFYHSSAIITTHISFFNTLFGVSKEDNFPLWQLANSVIILDEIQSYDNNLWWYMVEFFDKYAQLLNIKIIIMSATLPKLDYFLEKKDNFVELIPKNKKDEFFANSYFRNRISELNFSLLDEGKIELSRLFEVVQKEYKNRKVLIEFIKKSTAREFYNLLLEYGFKNVYELSGDDNKVYRNYVINKTKELNEMIIVATQVIEAGVDIDMDIGFKDISTIDSEEQFMGRINRSCKKNNSKVYFFDIDEASKIYVNDNRIDFNLKQKEYREILENKNFEKYYKKVLENIKNRGNKFENGVYTNYENFLNLVKKLNYKELYKTMQLINSKNFTLYFPFKIDISKYSNIKEFEGIEEFLTDNKLDGQKVWDKFIELDNIENFAEKKFKKSKINSLMQFFTFNLLGYKEPIFYDEKIKGIYFVKNYEEFIFDGKFDREKYNQKSDSQFL
jgi:CRISPR-associated endonuclease/helicase Cas3